MTGASAKTTYLLLTLLGVFVFKILSSVRLAIWSPLFNLQFRLLLTSRPGWAPVPLSHNLSHLLRHLAIVSSPTFVLLLPVGR